MATTGGLKPGLQKDILAMRRLPLRTCFLLTLLLLPAAHAVSFDCRKARTPREHSICSDPKLSALDTQLAAAYATARAQLSPEAAGQIQKDQREWLTFIDKSCPPGSTGDPADMRGCLSAGYEERRRQFRISHYPGGIVLYTRTHFILVYSRPDEKDKAENDPGFGTGTFEWPQIDRPTPVQARWNNAVFDAAVRLSAAGTPNEKNATSLDAGVDTGGTIDVDYTLRALNEHLIVTELGASTYGYGAAHPGTVTSSLLWWLDKGRELKPSDIFREGSNWQKALAPRVIAKLKAKDEVSDDKGWDVKKAVDTELTNPRAWTVTRSGLTIRFGQYEVAAYAVGMPEATFRWSELHEFLAPDLKIDDLPTPIPEPR
jgi:uncharacterized protein YecT (DUF1311 family)